MTKELMPPWRLLRHDHKAWQPSGLPESGRAPHFLTAMPDERVHLWRRVTYAADGTVAFAIFKYTSVCGTYFVQTAPFIGSRRSAVRCVECSEIDSKARNEGEEWLEG